MAESESTGSSEGSEKPEQEPNDSTISRPHGTCSDDIKKFEAEYPVINNLILHYSAVRTALTSFLTTAGLAAFGVYYQSQPPQRPLYLALVGSLLLVLALFASLIFSHRTERAVLQFKNLGKWRRSDERKPYPGFGKFKPRGYAVLLRMGEDWTNWLMFFGVILILGSFWTSNYGSALCHLFCHCCG